MDETQDEDDDDDERKEGRKGANELSSWAGSRREGKDRCNDYYTVENTELRRTGRYSANGPERKRGWTETTSYIVLIISILLADEVRVRIKEGRKEGRSGRLEASIKTACRNLPPSSRFKLINDHRRKKIKKRTASPAPVWYCKEKKKERERKREGRSIWHINDDLFFCRFVTPPPSSSSLCLLAMHTPCWCMHTVVHWLNTRSEYGMQKRAPCPGFYKESEEMFKRTIKETEGLG